MSDSEDEAAFASADEGDHGDVNEKGGGTKTKSESKDNSGAAAIAVPSDSGKKDTGQSKTQKKKGKKGGKKTGGNESKKTDTVKSDSGSKKSDNAKTGVKEEGKSAGKTEKTETEAAAKPKEVRQDVNKEKEPKAVKDLKPDDKDVKSSPSKSERTGKPNTEKPSEEKPVKEQDTQTGDTPEKSASPPVQVESPDQQTIPRSAGDGEVEGTEAKEPEKKESSGWGWGSWGSSLLTAASSSVSTFTSQVGEGFNTIVDSVESTLGAPPPEEIGQADAEKKKLEDDSVKAVEEEMPEKPATSKDETRPSEEGGESGQQEEQKEEEASEGGGGGGWFSRMGVTSLTSKIQNTGKSLVSGSLDAVEALATGSIDVLENIGKKTINVLSDHDPGFKKTKNIMFKDGDKKQNLSSLLREAKEKAEQQDALKEEQEEARKHNYGAVFDDFQGLAHLEALEILSNQSEKKVQALLSSLPPETVTELKPQLIDIKKLFELDDSDYEERQEHDFSKLITDLLSELHLGTTPDKLNKVQKKSRKWIIDFYADPAEGEEKKKTEPKEIFHAAIAALAELTAKSVEQFHKAGELVLLQQDADTSYEKRSKSLSSLTQVLCTEVSILSTKFTQCLHKAGEEVEDSTVITPFVTNVYLEASNSSTYIQDGFQLLLPVLQQAAIQNSTLLKS